MPVTSPLDSLAPRAELLTHAIECKFLFDRDLYTRCHVWLPDVNQRVSAVYADNQFYSFFKVVSQAQKVLDIVTRLGRRDEKVAITLTKQGYGIWAHEPNAHYSPPTQQPSHRIYPAFGPKTCLLLTDNRQYRPCKLQVPDMAKPLAAIAYRDRYYSIFKQDSDAAKLMDIAAKLARRGDDTLMALADQPYCLGLLEPNGRII